MSNDTPTHQDEPNRHADALRRRLRSAIEKAAGYRASTQDSAPDAPGASDADEEDARPLEEWHDLVSQRIEDAMRQGLFDNLSGHGKPLHIDRDPYLPEDQQMAATLLRNNNLSPAWIADRRAILDARERLRADLATAASRMRERWSSAQDDARRAELQHGWAKWLAGWQDRLAKLNDHILVYNLKQPVAHLEILMLRLSDELARAGVEPAWTQPGSDEEAVS